MTARDDFPKRVLSVLANRAGNRCSNPTCRRETSGPDTNAEGVVNLGVGAHITAAAPGGPRFDAQLRPDERAGTANGIWLCQWCAKLVDDDATQFTKAVLLQWKTSAETHAQTRLTTPERPQRATEPLLSLPSLNASRAWLTYSARATTLVGRADEYRELERFLQRDDKFVWWLIKGPSGAGKSRLALEICLSAHPAWNAGFLSRVDEFKDWSRLRPERPTLIVVDYVVTRASETGAMILQLSRSTAHFPNPVRVLLVERDEGSWWSPFLREDSQGESAEIEACQHAAPLELGPLSAKDLAMIGSEVAAQRKLAWSSHDAAAFEARMQILDPLGRPLFGMIAADAFTRDSPDLDSKALQRVLSRELARWRQQVPDRGRSQRIENLATLATLLGQLVARDGSFSFLATTKVANLLPNPDFLESKEYEGLVGAAKTDSLIPGLQPDLLGERFVLDRLAASGIIREATQRLVREAWALQPRDLCDFIVRAASDYPGDAGLAFVHELALDSVAACNAWSELAADLLRVANRSDEPQSQAVLSTLRNLVRSNTADAKLKSALARAEYNLGIIFHFVESDYERASVQYDTAIELAGSNSKVAAAALNNRGVLRNSMADEEVAFAEWSNVIAMDEASDEARACALNNRADLFAHRGAHAEAIRDRSMVLALRETSYNRRYIALSRRSRSLAQLGRTEEALADLDMVLSTEDIAPEQKANAQLDRGSLLAGLGRHVEARGDFDTVLARENVFNGTHARALVELAKLSRREGDPERAHEYLDAAMGARDADHRTHIEAFLVAARLLADAGDQDGAETIWLKVLANPNASARQKSIAERRGQTAPDDVPGSSGTPPTTQH
jgi:tetratricopeptide (TPR) repeat protein